MSDAFKTVSAVTKGEFKDRGSKFFGYLFPIKNEVEFQQKLSEIKSKHLKARHHCFAYQLLDKSKFRYNDDGEPSGTAGKPIYNQLLSYDIVNVGCVVVRYFGGTKLGTSGLINAYKQGAIAAINTALIITKYQTKKAKISFDYGQMGQLMEAIKKLGLNMATTDFGATPNIIIEENQTELVDKVLQLKAYLLNRSVSDVDERTQVEGIKVDVDI